MTVALRERRTLKEHIRSWGSPASDSESVDEFWNVPRSSACGGPTPTPPAPLPPLGQQPLPPLLPSSRAPSSSWQAVKRRPAQSVWIPRQPACDDDSTSALPQTCTVALVPAAEVSPRACVPIRRTPVVRWSGNQHLAINAVEYLGVSGAHAWISAAPLVAVGICEGLIRVLLTYTLRVEMLARSAMWDPATDDDYWRFRGWQAFARRVVDLLRFFGWDSKARQVLIDGELQKALATFSAAISVVARHRGPFFHHPPGRFTRITWGSDDVIAPPESPEPNIVPWNMLSHPALQKAGRDPMTSDGNDDDQQLALLPKVKSRTQSRRERRKRHKHGLAREMLIMQGLAAGSVDGLLPAHASAPAK